ncbi:MAG: hypothetical protein M3384_07980 [Acidobacteriota bacterium]|nr:hypothetical protein [Acidobacteriota bacterium]
MRNKKSYASQYQQSAYSIFKVFTLVVLVIASGAYFTVNAQICTDPPVQGAQFAWVKNAGVTVNISPLFNSALRQFENFLD